MPKQLLILRGIACNAGWLEGERLLLRSWPRRRGNSYSAPSASERRDVAVSLGREGFERPAPPFCLKGFARRMQRMPRPAPS